ncbi:type II secretion system F family protein [Roseibium limicola]|uniref:Type II secretion system F family protein n=1 Tax=Roseibium limicola TaxID=2816037 RepID=A0A939EQJ2_9HYPH|nr:type II secretion system F family protein [Roseibium limicola]MBO0345693.1 type II secretion system F family protein [Roseibium limicola]
MNLTDLQAVLGPQITFVAVALLATFSIGGVLYALLQPTLSGSKRRQERVSQISVRPQATDVRMKAKDGEKRRRSVQDQLKQFEERQRTKNDKLTKVSLERRLEQAGLTWERKHFIYFSLACGVFFMFLGLIFTHNLLLTAAFGFIGGLGFPRWYIGHRRKKRFNAFLNELPGAVDVIVRGVKAGLPLGDCLKVVAKESPQPVAGEFQKIVDTQVMGISLTDAVARLPERMPLAEANFFAIVVAIQQRAGGGLSEALGNLSKVLRSRKAMKRKITALSSEAKSSAAIIGCLPFMVTGILFLVAPDYIMLLFTTSGGQMIIAGGLFWMFCGIMVMRNMINFDF